MARREDEAEEVVADVVIDGCVEVRQVFETEDFGDELTPELREQEERIRAQAERNQ